MTEEKKVNKKGFVYDSCNFIRDIGDTLEMRLISKSTGMIFVTYNAL